MVGEHGIPFKPLLLIGGKSTRMGEPKHLMTTPSGETVLQHSFRMLSNQCPDSAKVYISLSQETSLDPVWCRKQDVAEFIFDMEPNHTATSAGPAAGLLAAFRSDSTATWLVMACDYPLLKPEALQQLCELYTPPVTCFRNKEGFSEPLIGIWSPAALAALADNVAAGVSSPTAVVRQLNGLSIVPSEGHEDWLKNVNTRKDWDYAVNLLREECEGRS